MGRVEGGVEGHGARRAGIDQHPRRIRAPALHDRHGGKRRIAAYLDRDRPSLGNPVQDEPAVRIVEADDMVAEQFIVQEPGVDVAIDRAHDLAIHAIEREGRGQVSPQ